MADRVLHPEVPRQLHDEAGPADRDVANALPALAEDDASLQLGGRVVEVDDGVPRAPQAFEGPADQLLARLGEDLDRDVAGDAPGFDEEPDEIEIGLRGGREAHLDLLEPHGDERVEHADLALMPHRLDEGLIAVAQIDGAPCRRAGDGP
jgi:hypothetical protein